MTEKYEQGDWVRFYREGRFVIGQVEYIHRAGLADICDTIMTDKGSIPADGVLETRKAAPVSSPRGTPCADFAIARGGGVGDFDRQRFCRVPARLLPHSCRPESAVPVSGCSVNRRRTDDPEQTFPRPWDATSLFGWPEAPKVTVAEQRGLEIPGSLEERYTRWRATAEGEAVYGWLAQRCTEMVAAGVTRLFVDQLSWTCRQELKCSLNNSYRSLLVRELIDRHPILRGAFELRKRSA